MAAELKELCTRGWNSDRPLVFAAFILPMAENVSSSNEILVHIDRRMTLCNQSRFVELLDDTVNVRRGIRGGPAQGDSAASREERLVQAYNRTLLSGRII